ncbi:MAG: winged helix-turn-helix domain-containing protein [Fimbriimonadaceae bacterium]
MAEAPLFPGQAEQLTYTLEQLLATTSVARTTVLWGFNEYTPLSVAEVAKVIGKSPQSVHAHVKKLVEVGLLIAVETRKKRSRIEKAYVYAARELFAPSQPCPPEFLGPMNARFANFMRNAAREMELARHVMQHDPSFGGFALMRYTNIMVTEEDARALRAFVISCIKKASDMHAGEGRRITLSFSMLPAVGESLQRYREVTGESLVEEPRDED